MTLKVAPPDPDFFPNDYTNDQEADEFDKYVNSWRKRIRPHLLSGDQEKMLETSIPALQANLLSLAFDGEKEATRLTATQYALEQAGKGAIKNVTIQHDYDTTPTEQLYALLQNALHKIQAANPHIPIASLLPPPSPQPAHAPIEVETTPFNPLQDR